MYDTRKVDDSIAEFSSDEILPQPGLVEFKGEPVEITQEQIDKAVENVRELPSSKRTSSVCGTAAPSRRTVTRVT